MVKLTRQLNIVLIKKPRFSQGLFIKIVFVYLKTKQQTNTNIIHIISWHYWDFDVTSPVGSDSGDGNHAFYGIGIDGKINETIKYRVEFESMSLGDGDNMKNIGVGLLFGF
jgi:hypothetical protein